MEQKDKIKTWNDVWALLLTSFGAEIILALSASLFLTMSYNTVIKFFAGSLLVSKYHLILLPFNVVFSIVIFWTFTVLCVRKLWN